MSETIFMDECEEILFFMENTPESRRMLREPIAKKLHDILRLRNIANGEMQAHERFLGRGGNCLEYACFPFTREEMESLGLDDFKYSFVSPFGAFDVSSIKSAKAEMVEFLQQSGYEVEFEKKSKILKSNQHRVALYFTEGFTKANRGKDFHLLMQKKDGTWSGKTGADSQTIEHFDNLEESLPHDVSNRYILDSIMVLTNPYALAEERQK